MVLQNISQPGVTQIPVFQQPHLCIVLFLFILLVSFQGYDHVAELFQGGRSSEIGDTDFLTFIERFAVTGRAFQVNDGHLPLSH